MAEPKRIYCPRCKRRVSKWDGRSSMNVIANCKRCKKRVVFYVNSQETKVTEIPQRNTSSGLVFY